MKKATSKTEAKKKIDEFFQRKEFKAEEVKKIKVKFDGRTVGVTNRKAIDRLLAEQKVQLSHERDIQNTYRFASGKDEKLSPTEFTNLTRRLNISGVKRPKRGSTFGYELGDTDLSAEDTSGREVYLIVNDRRVGTTTIRDLKMYNEERS